MIPLQIEMHVKIYNSTDLFLINEKLNSINKLLKVVFCIQGVENFFKNHMYSVCILKSFYHGYK